jgi:tetratricopeptide (TPR) repeat protein
VSTKPPAPQQDPNTGPWIRKYLLALLADPTLQPAQSGLLPSWLEQQIDPAVERDQPTHVRVPLQHVVLRSPATVLLGPAGSGKSTLIRQHVRELAQDALDNDAAPLPLYVPLTFFAGSIEATLAAQARMRGPTLATLALTRPCILIVDALNDLPPAEQVPVLGMLRRALSTLGPQGRWVIACRSEVWGLFDGWFAGGRFQVWRMRPWSDQTITSTAQRAGTPATERLLRIPGVIELARRPRWFGSFLQLADDALPGPLLGAWIKHTAVEAARTHCLPDQYADVALPLLQEIAAALHEHATLNRAMISNIVSDVAESARLQPVDVHALLEALALLHPAGDDEWVFRAPILGDFDLALELEAALARHKHHQIPAPELMGKANRTTALALLYGLLPNPQVLLGTLVATGAWEAMQHVVDANLGVEDALAVIDQTLHARPLLHPKTGEVDPGIVAALSRAWAHNGSPDVAIPLLEWTTSQNRGEPYLYGLLGNLHRQAGNYVEARNAYQEAVMREPTNAAYQQALATVRKALGEADAATTTFETLLTMYNDQIARAAFELGEIHEANGKLKEALGQYQRAAELFSPDGPEYGDAHLALARVLRELGRHDEAAQVLRNIDRGAADPVALAGESAALMEATGNDDQALEQLAQIEARGSATPTTFLSMAELHRRRDELDAADRAYRAAVELDGRCVPAYEGIADLAALANDYGTAISAYERIVDIEHTNADAWRMLGAFQRQAQRYAESARSLQTSLRLSMTPLTQLEMARTRWAQGDQMAALNYYRGAAAHDDEGRMIAEAGWALLESGDLIAAQPMLERAAALRPADGRVLYDLGRCYELQGAPARALEWFMQAAHVAPSPATLRATGRIARVLGEIPMARQMLARALYADRRNGETAAEVGRLHLQSGRPDLAARMLGRASMVGVEDVEVQRDLAEALLQLGNPRGALALLEAIPVDDNDLQTKRSRAYEQLGDPAGALAIARAAAARQPRNALLQRRVGSLALEAGLPAEALVALEAARALGDKELPTLTDLSRAMLQTGRVGAAMRPIEEALNRINQGAPDDIRVHVQRGRVLLAQEDWSEARAVFERALAVFDRPEAVATTVRQTADSTYWRAHRASLAEASAGLAEAMLRIGGPTAALPYARRALDLVPGTGVYLRLIGRLLLIAKDYRVARQVLASDTAVEPATLRLRLQVELADEQWDAAVPLAARCHAIMPNDLDVTADYGMALLNAGQPNEALPLLETACSSPAAHPAWCATLGRCWMALGNLDAAQDAFNRSLESRPDHAVTHADLAKAQLAAGAPGKAAHSLRQALELGGDRIVWRKMLAQAYVAQGWYAEALAEWEHARAKAPDDVSLRLDIARTRLELGNPEPALQELETLVANHADNADIWQLLSRAALACNLHSRAVYAAACALSQKPHDANLRVLLAEAALADGDAQRALDAVAPLVEAEEPNVKALLLVHRASKRLGDPARARGALERAGHVAGGDPDVQLAIAEHLLSMGDDATALRVLRRLFDQFRNSAPIAAALARLAMRGNALTLAREAAERALALSPQDIGYARLYGEICYAQGDFDTARRALQQAMKGRQDPHTAMLLGKLAMGRSETPDAQRLFRIAHEGRPGDPEPAGWLALALRRQYEPVHEDEAPIPQSSQALEAAVVLLRQAEQYPVWRAELGWTLVLAGDYENALKMLLSAARADEMPVADRVKALRRSSVVLLELGRAGDAMPQAERAADLDENDHTVQSILGQGAEILGDLVRAVAHYHRAATLDPDNGRYRLRLGAALLLRGETDASLEHLKRATELEPARAATWIAFSQALAHNRQLDYAQMAAQRAIQTGQNDGFAWRQFAAVAEEAGDFNTALDALERAIAYRPERDGRGLTKQWLLHFANLAIKQGSFERGRKALQAAADIDPQDADLLHQLAQFHSPNERIALLRRALTLLPKAAWRTELATLLAARGDHQPALEQLRQAIEAEPRNPVHWIALARAQQDIGDTAAASKTMEQATETNPNQAVLLDAWSVLLAQQGRWAEALYKATEALEIAPTADRWAQCGRCQQKLERWTEARRSLQTALDLDATHAAAATYLAETLMESNPNGAWRDAIRYAEIATEHAETEVAGFKVLARAALKGKWQGRLETALEQASALAPNDPELHELRGWRLFYDGKDDLALVEAEQAIAYDPRSANAYYLLAQIHKREQRYQQAIAALRMVVRLDGSFTEAIKELTQVGLEALIHGGK